MKYILIESNGSEIKADYFDTLEQAKETLVTRYVSYLPAVGLSTDNVKRSDINDNEASLVCDDAHSYLCSKPLLNAVRFVPLKQWNRKRQYTAKSCVRPTTYDTRPYEVLGLAKRQGRKCERHVRF